MRRRSFLQATPGAFAALPLLARLEKGSPRAEDAIEDALERLAGTGPEYGGGLANHGPMAAEALARLGRPEAIASWVDGYRKKLQGALSAPRAVTEAEWREALGDYRRAGDWAALFERELRDAPWPAVLQKWAARLAPGLSAAACHGLIRTGQACRALAERDTPLRRRELAQGLAYWAARYQALPERAATAGHLRPGDAVARIPVLPEERRGRGLISEALAGLSALPAFADVADMVDVDAAGFLSDLTEAFAGVYIAQARRGSRIAFIHAVTGPSAVRLLLPHVDDAARPRLLRYAWQVCAAVYAGYAAAPNPAPDAPPPSRAALVEGAVATGDEHAFKFTEACLREHTLRPSPLYFTAAAQAVEALS